MDSPRPDHRRTLSPYLILLPWLSGLAGAATLAQAPPRLVLHELAAVGDQAPGAAPGTVIATIGDAPRIDDAGDVSWVVTLRDAAGGFAQALYRRVDGATEQVFASGDLAPGTGEDFALFPGVPQSGRIHGGRLSFAASLTGADGRAGVWSDRFGGFERLLLTGDHLPGTPAAAEVASFGFVLRRDVLVGYATFGEGGGVAPGNEGLWRNRTGAWEPVLVRGMPAPGLSGAVFDTDPMQVFGPLFSTATRDDGSIAAQAWVRGRGIDGNNDEALWVEKGGGLQMLVREGARVGGAKGKTTFGPATSEPVFGGDGVNLNLAMNDLGAVVFGAVLRSGKTQWNSVWTSRGGTPELVARGGLPISGYGKGDPAPGLAAGATFGIFQGSAINDDGTIAFQGFADETGSSFALTAGIWWDEPGTLALVAAEGRPVPGAPGAAYADLTLEGLTDAGALYFSATLTGPGVAAGNDVAVLRATAGGAPVIVLREGDLVEVIDGSGARTERTVATFAFGPGVETAARAAVDVSFADGSAGVYVIDPLP